MLVFDFKRVGLRVCINPLWLAVWPLLAVFMGIGACAALFISAALHETAHGLAGAICGEHPRKIELSLLGLSIELPQVSFLPLYKKIAVYLSGPVVNLFIAAAAMLYRNETVFVINASLCIFNLLPIRTLDGGRILMAVLSRYIGFMRASRFMRAVERCFFVVVFIFGIIQIVLFPYNISLICLERFLRRQASEDIITENFRFTRSILHTNEKYSRAQLAVKHMAVSENASAKELFDRLSMDTLYVYHVYKQTGETVSLTEAALIKAIRKHGLSVKLREFI